MRYSTQIKSNSYVKEETLALLKILALGNQQIARGKVKPVGEAVKRLRDRNALTDVFGGLRQNVSR